MCRKLIGRSAKRHAGLNGAHAIAGQSVYPDKPSALALMPMSIFRGINSGPSRRGHRCDPVQKSVIMWEFQPASFKVFSQYPSALRSIFKATKVKKTANTRLSGLGSIACASFTP